MANITEITEPAAAFELARNVWINQHAQQINQEAANGQFSHDVYLEKDSALPIDALIQFVGGNRRVVDKRPIDANGVKGPGTVCFILEAPNA